jgi:hypothetical protein
VKCDSISGTGKGAIHFIGYENGLSIPLHVWETSVEIPDYTYVEIPIDNLENYDSIRIRVEAFTGNNSVGSPTGYSSILVDEITEIYPLQTVNAGNNDFNFLIYPNPTVDELVISSKINSVDFQYIVYDEIGKLIYTGSSSGNLTNVNTKLFNQGKYTLKIFSSSSAILIKEFVFLKGK